MISGESLSRLFELCSDTVKCVVLNACYSEAQANAISQHIDYVVGMKKAIGDKAAIKFAVGFYDALGAGRDFEKAFKFGCIAIDLKGIPEYLTPVLKKRSFSATGHMPPSSAIPPIYLLLDSMSSVSRSFTLRSRGWRFVCSRWRARQHGFGGGRLFTGLGYS